MIALDTNLLVRLFTGDDRAQTAKVMALLTRLADRGDRALVTTVVVCEIAWVLRDGYGHSRDEILAALRVLQLGQQLTLDEPDLVMRAADAYEAGRGDFADYAIRERARAAGCERVLTFDKKLLREPMFGAP